MNLKEEKKISKDQDMNKYLNAIGCVMVGEHVNSVWEDCFIVVCEITLHNFKK